MKRSVEIPGTVFEEIASHTLGKASHVVCVAGSYWRLLQPLLYCSSKVNY